ncbi:hypothetical protein [Nocardioides immobilis]|uniref:hypothetical protein n=1 Tax=Nocardioides immobilis TaxID=2049295 RepID=UPI0015F78944|nr:hypothetical protein [Nocardioides immobilis]
MRDVLTADRPRLEMRWVPVTDEQGRTRPQAVWIEAGTAASTQASTAPPATVHHAA